MNERDIARLLVRFAGLLTAVESLLELPISLSRALKSDSARTGFDLLVMAIAPAALPIAAGLAMYWFAGRIADRTMVDRAAPGAPLPDLRRIEAVALAVLGLYECVTGASGAMYYWSEWHLYYDYAAELGAGMKLTPPPITPTVFAGLVEAGMRIVLGLVLFLCSGGIVALRRAILSLRSAGFAE